MSAALAMVMDGYSLSNLTDFLLLLGEMALAVAWRLGMTYLVYKALLTSGHDRELSGTLALIVLLLVWRKD